MEEGHYKVEFFTINGYGSGVVMIVDGVIGGGDSMMAYNGIYTVSEGILSATVNVNKHSSVAGMTSVLGVDNATISLVGLAHSHPIQLTLREPSLQGLQFHAQLTKLAPLRP